MHTTEKILDIERSSANKNANEITHFLDFKFNWLSVIVFLLLSLNFSAVFAAPVAVINNTVTHIPLDHFVDILNDPDRKISQNNVLESTYINQFAPIDLSNLSTFDDISNHYWLRFSVRNDDSILKTFWLSANIAAIKSLSVYSQDSNSVTNLSLENDVFTPQNNLAPILKEIIIPAKSTKTYLLQINATNKNLLKLELTQAADFLAQKIKISRQYSFGLGILTMLGLLSLFFTLYRKSLIFLYQTCFIFGNIGLQITLLEIPRNWFPSFDEWQFSAIICCLFICSVNGLMCAQEYLKKSNIYTKYNSALIYAQYFCAYTNLIILIIFDTYSPIVLLPIAILIPLILAVMLHCYKKNNDFIALGIFSIIIVSTILFCVAFAILYNTFDKEVLSNYYFLYLVAFSNTAIFFLLIIKDNILVESMHKKLNFKNIKEAKNKAQIQLMTELNLDMRTHISGVLGMAELLKTSSLTSDQLSKVDAIKNSGQALLSKVANMNYRIQIQQNNGMPKKSPLELISLIENSVTRFQLEAENKHIEFIVNIQSDVPSIVEGDELLLSEVIIQILDNAIKNTAQGEILIKVSCSASDPDKITFLFKDTGKGISPFKIELHSEQPNTSDQSIEHSEDLPTIQQVLSQLKSELHVSSTSGEGNSFSFTLYLPSVATSQQKMTSLDEILKNKRLLIVDDNHTCCKVLKQQATNWGMQVIESYSGYEALAIYRSKNNLNEPFDAIIIDYDMPELTGIQLAEKILLESNNPPIMIMLTGINTTISEHMTKEAGIMAVLIKPATQKLIKLTLGNLLQDQPKEHAGKSQKFLSLKALIADDNDVSRRVLGSMMKTLGIEYKLVTNGQLAFDAIKKDQFDFILMDCEMPLMDGLEATKNIHQWQRIKQQKSVPVIALSANTLQETLLRNNFNEISDYLEKPISMEKLIASIEKIIKPS